MYFDFSSTSGYEGASLHALFHVSLPLRDVVTLRKNSGCYQNIEEGQEKNPVLLLKKRRAEVVLILRDNNP